MAAIVPSDFLRVKYRRPAIEPELNEEDRNEKALSMAKKERPEEINIADEFQELRFKPPTMLPAFTQTTRVEKVIESQDKEYRRLTKPTLFEQVETQRQLVKQQLRDEIAQANAEKAKAAFKEAMAKLAAGVEDEENVEEEAEEKHDAEAEYEEEAANMDADDAAEFRRLRLEQKEKRVLRTRNSHEYHFAVDKWKRRISAIKLALRLGSPSKTFVEVLPWILLGAKEDVVNQHRLIDLGVTHIMNVTDNEPNEFPSQFVYLKIPIRDDEEQDILDNFPQAINFFQRVEEKRGRIFVHCSAGVSRAPAMVAAYLVAKRKISLYDTYSYLKAIRPIVSMNSHFLFHLALLEMKQNKGCSVYFHRDWNFYEFNMIKASIDPQSGYREPQGLFHTVLQLLRKVDDDDII